MKNPVTLDALYSFEYGESSETVTIPINYDPDANGSCDYSLRPYDNDGFVVTQSGPATFTIDASQKLSQIEITQDSLDGAGLYNFTLVMASLDPSQPDPDGSGFPVSSVEIYFAVELQVDCTITPPSLLQGGNLTLNYFVDVDQEIYE